MTTAASINNDRPLLGVSLMIAGMLIIPALDICAKLLSEEFQVLQVTWSRFVFNFLWLVPLLLLRREKWWRLPRHPWIQMFRGLCLLMATLFFFTCIKTNPIPNALAILFISPLIVTLLSPWILGETFGIRRFIATIAGFIGVLVVLQPTGNDFQPSLLYAMLAGLSYAFYILITRKVSTSSSPLMTLFYTALVGTVALLPWMPSVWITPDSEALLIMSAMGLIAASGHFLVILSCQYAPASLVSPFNYAEIIGATLLSYLFFDYFPNHSVWLGILIICGSGIYISMREFKLHRNATVIREQH
jgi:drug/metabolite transporter (DMT)-like permease